MVVQHSVALSTTLQKILIQKKLKEASISLGMMGDDFHGSFEESITDMLSGRIAVKSYERDGISLHLMVVKWVKSNRIYRRNSCCKG